MSMNTAALALGGFAAAEVTGITNVTGIGGGRSGGGGDGGMPPINFPNLPEQARPNWEAIAGALGQQGPTIIERGMGDSTGGDVWASMQSAFQTQQQLSDIRTEMTDVVTTVQDTIREGTDQARGWDPRQPRPPADADQPPAPTAPGEKKGVLDTVERTIGITSDVYGQPGSGTGLLGRSYQAGQLTGSAYRDLDEAHTEWVQGIDPRRWESPGQAADSITDRVREVGKGYREFANFGVPDLSDSDSSTSRSSSRKKSSRSSRGKSSVSKKAEESIKSIWDKEIKESEKKTSTTRNVRRGMI